MVDEETKRIEAKWQKHWEDKKIWEVKPTKSKEKYFGNVAYPYANSVLHIGHGRTFTIADVYLRYQRLLGKNVLYPLGYHISGTPVLAVADGIKRKDEKVISQVRNAISDYVVEEEEQDKLIDTFCEPEAIANFFSTKIEGALNSIGVSICYNRQFTTGEPIYNKFIEWQYEKLKNVGILKQGKYPILYSPEDENAVGEDDIKDGDLDKVSISEMTLIKFQLKDKKEFLVAATLRPDSLFGTTNLYVKPEMKLVKLKVNSQVWIVSKASQSKIEHQFEDIEFVSEHKGEEFLGLEVNVPILNKFVPIYPMDYPDEDHGTGIVYSSPADSPHDYIYLFELKFPNKNLKEFESDPLKLKPITKTKDKKGNLINYKSNIPAFDKLHKFQIYNVKGSYEKLERAKIELYKEAHFGAVMINCGEFDNTPLKGNIGANKVREKLEKLNLGGIFYETSRRAITRGGGKVIVANLQGQWFLDYSDPKIKAKAHEFMDYVNYLPKNLIEAQRNYIDWVNLRPCARKRGLGTKLPFDKNWIIEPLSDSTIYQMFYMISNIIRKYDIKPEALSFDVFDYVFFKKGEKNKIKVSSKALNEMREEVVYWNNVDFRYTAHSHMSNHLNFLIYHYALIFPKSMWPKKLVVGQFMMRNGQKISKSKGNGTPLYRMKNIYGADLYRLYTIITASFDAEMDFKDEEVLQLEKKFNKFKDLMFKAKNVEKKKYSSFSQIDKWLISKFYSKCKEYFELMAVVKIREAYVGIIYEFMTDLSYHTRRTNEKQTTSVLRYVFGDYLKIMTPVVPHICEELNLNESKLEISLQNFTTNCEDYINSESECIEAIVEYTLALISRTKDQKQMSQIRGIKIVQASKNRFKLFDELKKQLEKTKNIKEIFKELNSKFPLDIKFISKFVPKTLGEGLSFYLSIEKEKKLIEDVKSFFKKEFDCEVEISNIEKENINSLNVMPSKPGVILE